VESKYTSRGARLIEVNARMGGGGVRWGAGTLDASCLLDTQCGASSKGGQRTWGRRLKRARRCGCIKPTCRWDRWAWACRDINRLVWGVDLVEEHLLASCGLPARPIISKRPLINLAGKQPRLGGAGWGRVAHVLGKWRRKRVRDALLAPVKMPCLPL